MGAIRKGVWGNLVLVIGLMIVMIQFAVSL